MQFLLVIRGEDMGLPPNFGSYFVYNSVISPMIRLEATFVNVL